MTREEQKKLLAKDLHVIVTMSSEYDMSNKKLRGQVRAVLVKKNSLKTKIGDLYLSRLSRLDQGYEGATCILCKKEKAVDGILCDSCMDLYTKGRLVIKKTAKMRAESAGRTVQPAPQPAPQPRPIEQPKPAPQPVVQPVPAPQPAPPKKVIHLQPINKIDPDAEPAFPDVVVRKERLLNEKQITRLVWFGCIVMVISLIATYLILNNKTITVKDSNGIEFIIDNKTKGNVKDVNEAEKLVYKEFPGASGWEIFSNEESTSPMGWSWTPVGYSVENAKEVLPNLVDSEFLADYGEKELCWVFRMKKADSRKIIGKVYVNCRGMVYLEGDFEQCPISEYIYRVK